MARARTSEATREKQRRSGRAASRTWPAHWAMGEALTRVQASVTAAGGGDLLAELRSIKHPVERARKIAELLAPADMLTSAAIGLGVDPLVLEAHRSAYRLIADLSHKRLSIVGLRSGEAVEVQASDRMQDFMARFFGRRRNTAGERESTDDTTD